MEPFVFVAERAVPELGVQAGERIVVRPGADYPVVVQRDAPPNYGLLLLALEAGDLRPLTPISPDALRAAVGMDGPPRPLAPHPRRWRGLSVIR